MQVPIWEHAIGNPKSHFFLKGRLLEILKEEADSSECASASACIWLQGQETCRFLRGDPSWAMVPGSMFGILEVFVVLLF